MGVVERTGENARGLRMTNLCVGGWSEEEGGVGSGCSDHSLAWHVLCRNGEDCNQQDFSSFELIFHQFFNKK